jgi:hypothetical protein
MVRERPILFLMFGLVDASLDLANLFGDRDLLRIDFCALPQGLTIGTAILMIELDITPF